MTQTKITLLNQQYQRAIDQYLELSNLVIINENNYSKENLLSELNHIENLTEKNAMQTQILTGILHLVLWTKFRHQQSNFFLEKLQRYTYKSDDKILLVCGDSRTSSKADGYKEYIEAVFQDFSGVVISGGTNSGLPGIVGELRAKQKASGFNTIKAIGYLPENKQADPGYDQHILTKSDEFSVLEVLTYWADILMSGKNPQEVILLGIGGGYISSVEYKMGILLGARTYLIRKYGGSAKEVSDDASWNRFPNQYTLPSDPHAIWSIVKQKM